MAADNVPIEKELFCPECDHRHIDWDEWKTRPHRTHKCLFCGHLWRPFEYNTVGSEGPEAIRYSNTRGPEWFGGDRPLFKK